MYNQYIRNNHQIHFQWIVSIRLCRPLHLYSCMCVLYISYVTAESKTQREEPIPREPERTEKKESQKKQRWFSTAVLHVFLSLFSKYKKNSSNNTQHKIIVKLCVTLVCWMYRSPATVCVIFAFYIFFHKFLAFSFPSH